MRRSGLAALAVAVMAGTGPLAACGSTGSDPVDAAPVTDPAADIAAVTELYETFVDADRPVDETVALIEDGEQVRDEITELMEVDTVAGLRLADISFTVDDVRLHGDTAEVRFSILRSGFGDAGLAVRTEHGWRIAAPTFCRLAGYAGIRCSDVPTTPTDLYAPGVGITSIRAGDGRSRVPVVFPDGTRMQLDLPIRAGTWRASGYADLSLFEREIDISFVWGDVRTEEVAARYPGPAGDVIVDAAIGMVIPGDEWHAIGYAADLDEEARAAIAANVEITSELGYPVVDTAGPVQLVGRGVAAAAVQSVKGLLGDGGPLTVQLFGLDAEAPHIVVGINGCTAPRTAPVELELGSTDEYAAAEMCLGRGIHLGVEGSRSLVEQVAAFARIRQLEPAEVSMPS
jgi:hypothetical protein